MIFLQYHEMKYSYKIIRHLGKKKFNFCTEFAYFSYNVANCGQNLLKKGILCEAIHIAPFLIEADL